MGRTLEARIRNQEYRGDHQNDGGKLLLQCLSASYPLCAVRILFVYMWSLMRAQWSAHDQDMCGFRCRMLL